MSFITSGPYGDTENPDAVADKKGRRWLRPVVLFLLLCAGAAYFLFGDTKNALHVMRDTRVTQGTIMELRSDHVVVFVRYAVDGVTHQIATNHTEEAGLGPFDKLREGDSVPVEYNPVSPGNGIPGSARKLLRSNLKDFAGAALFCVFITGAVEFMIRRQLATSN